MFKRLLCFGDSFCSDTGEGSFIDNLRLEFNPGMSIEHEGLSGSTPVKTFLEIQDFDILSTDLVIVTFSYASRILDNKNNPLPGFPHTSLDEWNEAVPIMYNLNPDADFDFLYLYYLKMYNDTRQSAVASCKRLGVNKILSDIGCTYVCLEVSEEFKNYQHSDNAISFPGLSLESLADTEEYNKEQQNKNDNVILNHMTRETNLYLSKKISKAIRKVILDTQ